MIISELNYLEAVEANVAGATGLPSSTSFNKDFNVDSSLTSKVNLVNGEYFADTRGVNRAFGDATYTQSEVVNLAGNGQSVSDFATIAAAKDFGKKY
jgi:hypothetical protein